MKNRRNWKKEGTGIFKLGTCEGKEAAKWVNW